MAPLSSLPSSLLRDIITMCARLATESHFSAAFPQTAPSAHHHAHNQTIFSLTSSSRTESLTRLHGNFPALMQERVTRVKGHGVSYRNLRATAPPVGIYWVAATSTRRPNSPLPKLFPPLNLQFPSHGPSSTMLFIATYLAIFLTILGLAQAVPGKNKGGFPKDIDMDTHILFGWCREWNSPEDCGQRKLEHARCCKTR